MLPGSVLALGYRLDCQALIPARLIQIFLLSPLTGLAVEPMVSCMLLQ